MRAAGDLALQVGVGDGAPVPRLALPVQGDLLPGPGLDVPVDAVARDVQRAVGEPGDLRPAAAVVALRGGAVPLQAPGLRAPERLRVDGGLVVGRSGDVGVRGELGRGRVHAPILVAGSPAAQVVVRDSPVGEGPVVVVEQVHAEVVLRVTPHRVGVVRAVLGVVPLQQQPRPLQPVVVRLPRLRRPRPGQVGREQAAQQVAAAVVERARRDTARRAGERDGLGALDRVHRPGRALPPDRRGRQRPIARRDPRPVRRHQVRRRPGGEDRDPGELGREPADDLPGQVLGRPERARDTPAEQRRRRGVRAEEARRGRGHPPVDDECVHRHVVPAEAPAPGARARVTEDPQVVERRVTEPLPVRPGGPVLRPVQDVLQPHDRRHGGVAGLGQPRGDQPHRALLLDRGLRVQRQPAVVGGGVEPATTLGVGPGVAGRAVAAGGREPVVVQGVQPGRGRGRHRRGDRLARRHTGHASPPGGSVRRVADEQRDLHPVVQTQLAQQPGHVGLHRRHRHVQLGGDVGVGAAAGDGLGDVALAVGEPVEAGPGGAPAVDRPGAVAADDADQPPGDRRGQHGVAVGGGADGLDDPLGRGVLEQEPARPGAQRPHDVLVGVERGPSAPRAAAPRRRRRAPRHRHRRRRPPRCAVPVPSRRRAARARRASPAARIGRAGRRRRAAPGSRSRSSRLLPPRQHRAQQVPRRRRAVGQRPAGEGLDPLAQPDQAGPGTLGRRTGRGRPGGDGDGEVPAGPPVEGHLDPGPGCVPGGVGQTLPDHPVHDAGQRAPRRGHRQQRRRPEADVRADRAGLGDELLDRAEVVDLVGYVAGRLVQHLDDRAQVLHRAVGGVAQHPRGLADGAGGQVPAQRQRPGVHRQQRQPVSEPVVHLPGDPAPLVGAGLLLAHHALGLGAGEPLTQVVDHRAADPGQQARGHRDGLERDGPAEEHEHRRPVRDVAVQRDRGGPDRQGQHRQRLHRAAPGRDHEHPDQRQVGGDGRDERAEHGEHREHPRRPVAHRDRADHRQPDDEQRPLQHPAVACVSATVSPAASTATTSTAEITAGRTGTRRP
ncbi:hypothetical protein L7F22_009766 [Adiantum nelumboides]|nr:hypothetical protein [Adiantum nelumboides]